MNTTYTPSVDDIVHFGSDTAIVLDVKEKSVTIRILEHGFRHFTTADKLKFVRSLNIPFDKHKNNEKNSPPRGNLIRG